MEISWPDAGAGGAFKIREGSGAGSDRVWTLVSPSRPTPLTDTEDQPRIDVLLFPRARSHSGCPTHAALEGPGGPFRPSSTRTRGPNLACIYSCEGLQRSRRPLGPPSSPTQVEGLPPLPEAKRPDPGPLPSPGRRPSSRTLRHDPRPLQGADLGRAGYTGGHGLETAGTCDTKAVAGPQGVPWILDLYIVELWARGGAKFIDPRPQGYMWFIVPGLETLSGLRPVTF